MASIKLICVAQEKSGQTITVDQARILAQQGIDSDRYCSLDTPRERQITLIESEVIDDVNRLTGASLTYEMFRRNLVTQNIRLNNLLGSEFSVGKIRLRAHELCEPCGSLQNRLQLDGLVKQLTHRGGLCCEILDNGVLHVGDEIKT
ncbi:MAG: sulfurase [Acidiferrobacteraceae bacterium]|nr:sulfurase [Acidiferrobacteraceae bacterium]